VVRAELVADHRPENAMHYQPASDGGISSGATLERLAPGRRPTRLLDRPAPITVELAPDGVPRCVAPHALASARGPERIETGFWDGDEVRRDYWIVAFEDGR